MSSLVKSIQNAIPPVNREGYPFIAIFAVVTLVVGYFISPLFWIGLGLTIWCVAFFRDPARVTPVNDDLVVSPADGKISQVGAAIPPKELGLGSDPMIRISVFMNVFNCHVNRAPISGRIDRIAYKPGKFLNAELDKASEDNERNGLVITGNGRTIGVVQIAGLVARRIVSWVKDGEDLRAGERFGMIRFGSRLDVYLPDEAVPKVAIGQTAIAGETVLAEFTPGSRTVLTRVS